MRSGVSCVTVSMLLWGVPRLAGADPITIRLDRFVSVSASVSILGADVEDDISEPAGDSLFRVITVSSGPNTATGAQSLSSFVSSDSRQFSGSGRTSAIAESPFAGNGTGARAGGGVGLTWDFRLDQPHVFDFDTTVTTSSDDVGLFFGTSLAALHGSVFEPVFSHESRGTGGSGIVNHGRIEAGRYSFFFQSSAGVGAFEGTKAGSMDFDFSLDLAPAAPIPEPGTISLIGIGVAAVAAGYRKRRRRSAGTAAACTCSGTRSRDCCCSRASRSSP